MDRSEQRWSRVRGALHSEVARVAELLRSLPTGEARGGGRRVGSWDAGDVAMHLSQVWLGLPALARGDLAEVAAVMPVAAGAGRSLVASLDDLAAFTAAGVRSDPERDPVVLAERIETRATRYLDEGAASGPHERRPWLVDGVTVPLPVLGAHLLNETVVHGYDLARTTGRSWRIDPVHAGLVVDEFMMPVLAAAGGGLPGGRPPRGTARGVCELRVRGGGRHRLRLGDGAVVPDDGEGRPDCVLSVDPVAFLLVFFGRWSPAVAVARGGFVVWGRRPWLVEAFLATMPSP